MEDLFSYMVRLVQLFRTLISCTCIVAIIRDSGLDEHQLLLLRDVV